MTSLASPCARILVLCLFVSALSACSLLPRSGPTRNEIFADLFQREGDAFVVEVDQRVTAATADLPALGFPPELVNAGQFETDVIRQGDLISITIYENVAEALLSGDGASPAVIDEVQVDSAGLIFIPYVGRIRAEGYTLEALRGIITSKLDEQTPDPQVIVRRTSGDGGTVTVSGNVGGQGVYTIRQSTRTLSGILAAAGGVTVKPEITQVTLVRGRHRGTIWFQDLYRDPSVDIALRTGDRILVEGDTRSFTALGAIGKQSILTFETQVISAVEAIAWVGGLNPELADPTGIFVLRDEPEQIARAVLGRDDLIGTQRMVYVLDMTAPTGMFDARNFVIRDRDTVYVAAAPITQWNNALSALTGTLNNSSGAANALVNAAGQ